MKFLVLCLLANTFGLATASRVNLFERAGCNADNCFRGVSVSSLLPSRSADCLAYMASSTLPKYAAACTSLARYSSACSCIGATIVVGATTSSTSSSTLTSTTSTSSSVSSDTSPNPAQITITSTQTFVSTVTNTVTSTQTAMTTVTNTQRVDTTMTNTETSVATVVQTVSITVTNTQFLNTTSTQTFATTSTDFEQATTTNTQTVQTTVTNFQTANTTFTNIISTTSTSTSTQLYTASSTVTVTSTSLVAIATPVTGTCPINGGTSWLLTQHQVNGGYIQGDDSFGNKANNYYGGFLARVVSGANAGQWLYDWNTNPGYDVYFVGLTSDKNQATAYNMVSSYIVSVKNPSGQIMEMNGGFIEFGADSGGAASCSVTPAPAGVTDGRIGMLTCYQPGLAGTVGKFTIWAGTYVSFYGPNQAYVPPYSQEVVSIAVYPLNCPM